MCIGRQLYQQLADTHCCGSQSHHPIHEDGWVAVTHSAVYTDSVPISQGLDEHVIVLDPPATGLPTI